MLYQLAEVLYQLPPLLLFSELVQLDPELDTLHITPSIFIVQLNRNIETLCTYKRIGS